MPSASGVSFMPAGGIVSLLWLALPLIAIAIAVPLGSRLMQARPASSAAV